MSDSVNVSSLLVIVLDTNPAWWGRGSVNGDKKLALSKCVDSLMVFANSHLMMNHLNKLAFIAAHSNASHFLYPKKQSEGLEAVSDGELNDGKYELFDRMNYLVKEEVKDLVLNSMEVEFENDSLIAGAVSMALCYIHRMEKEAQLGVKISSRILVVKASEDNPAQYMNFMNTIFTAQKLNIVIDACILDNDSGLLQQACDITGGVYLKIPQPQGLLQYLLWVYLPDPSTRERLTLPPRAQVDYRAACFCHRNLIDIGYVCSVCLSIFCTFSPICSTCQTTFKIIAPPKLVRKKSKKNLTAT
ncbi:general transcription factor IIH subunit 3-like [Mercenaria mercenaria]|uniref:general transcription factor IIH subunit 3-like n=1 Tax=Mercenaria mercenaria TaxID=6596 RepID=UPI00234F147A|nr:general transcription factor IIH subunit 3-like [Mercenaria mercenaria]